MIMFDVKKMGEQIANLRTGNKYTQEQLAEKLKVSKVYLLLLSLLR